jgi:hypothetical protein
MTTPSTIFNGIKTKLFEAYSGDAGKMLLHTATLAWITSAAAQIVGIAANDKVSKDQKKFLIPQEIADAAINIASFYFVTNSLQNCTKWLASSGKIITPEIVKFCKQHNIQTIKGKDGKTPNIGKAILDKIGNLKTTLEINKKEKIYVEPAKSKKIKNEVKELSNFFNRTYDPFESGLKIAGNIVGAVVSSNIITPLLRNPIAAARQKQSIAQEKYQNGLEKPASPVYLAQNKMAYETYKSKVLNPPSGSIKI